MAANELLRSAEKRRPMMPSVSVYFLPSLVSPAELAGQTVVVIDVLRATTTICTALAQGARDVIPCLEIADALEVAARIGSQPFLLGGERAGLPIPGFHIGNSPSEYRPERVRDRTLIFTTTNGTRALRHAAQAARVIIGAFVNAGAVAAALASESRIALLCAGTDGHITREDVLLAGYLVEQLSASSPQLNDQALLARDAWQHLNDRSPTATPSEAFSWLDHELCNTAGGRNLMALGLAADITAAAQLDQFSLVPELNIASWSIR